MIIDVPIVIYIDTETYLPHAQAVAKVAMTLRFDTDDTDEQMKFCTGYPPKPTSTFWDDSGDVFAMALGNNEYKKLIARARSNPYDYAANVTEEERNRLQEIADAAKEPNI